MDELGRKASTNPNFIVACCLNMAVYVPQMNTVHDANDEIDAGMLFPLLVEEIAKLRRNPSPTVHIACREIKDVRHLLAPLDWREVACQCPQRRCERVGVVPEVVADAAGVHGADIDRHVAASTGIATFS